MNTITNTNGFPQITRTAWTGRFIRQRTHRSSFDLHEFFGWVLLATIAVAAGLTTVAFIDLTDTWHSAAICAAGLSPILLVGGLIRRYAGIDAEDN